MRSKIKLALRRGNITLITAAISVLLVGIVALVTDVGSLYYDHARLQTATNAAWKAGYDKLAEIRKTKSRLTAEDETAIKNNMKEVLAANGFGNLNDEQLKILFTNNQTNLQIYTNYDAQLFFMKMFDIKKATVAASRAGGSEAFSILPIAIPHGEVHDLSWKTYDYIPFSDGEGFATGTEYILKLGEAEKTDVPIGEDDYMIYIPTGFQGNQTSDYNVLLAYGAVFYALQIDGSDSDSATPAYWILSDNGGGFLLPKNANFEQKLTTGDYSSIRYFQYKPDDIRVLLNAVGAPSITVDQINDYLTGINSGSITNKQIIPLINRPKIAIYSSQSNLDPVEEILVSAKIPYGNYALPKSAKNPNGWDRTTNYDSSKNTKVFDIEILNGELDKFDWIHLHHEDFTGLTQYDGQSYISTNFPTKCTNPVSRPLPGASKKDFCYNKVSIGLNYSATSSITAENNIKSKVCAFCRNYMTFKKTTISSRKYKVEFTGWSVNETELFNGCNNIPSYKIRCGTCGTFDENNLRNQTNFKGCKFFNYLQEHYGYEDDEFDPYVFGSSQLNLSAEDLCAKWFIQATAYQKMKWGVAEKIKEHILKGGFMYTQCFAAETLDLSLQQGAYYKTKSLQASYDNCLVFENFNYLKLPAGNGYSSIDSNKKAGNGSIQTAYKYSALCQTYSIPNANTGYTSGFNDACVKRGIDKMIKYSSYSDYWMYLGGQLTNSQGEKKGQFTLMGGHSAKNIHAKRLVLNNVLLGSTSDKETSIGEHIPGRTKYQYGCVDLNNDGNRCSSDYSKWMLYGYEAPVNYADIVSTDNGKYTDETTNSINTITGKIELASYTPDQIVIVPIVGVPDSVKTYQATVTKSSDQVITDGSYTIYDLKVGASNSGAADYDNLNSLSSPTQLNTTSLKNSVQIIGFAKFRIKATDEYNRSDVLGEAYGGQIRGEFLEYIIDPRETAELLEQYNYGN